MYTIQKSLKIISEKWRTVDKNINKYEKEMKQGSFAQPQARM